MSSELPFAFIGQDQNINPWHFWSRFSQQAGFINIHAVQSGDPQLERKILENVAGYGRQLGILMDFLAVVARDYQGKKLSGHDERALSNFQTLVQEVNREKIRHGASLATSGGVNRMLEDLERLKERDPEAYRILAARLKEGVAP